MHGVVIRDSPGNARSHSSFKDSGDQGAERFFLSCCCAHWAVLAFCGLVMMTGVSVGVTSLKQLRPLVLTRGGMGESVCVTVSVTSAASAASATSSLIDVRPLSAQVDFLGKPS